MTDRLRELFNNANLPRTMTLVLREHSAFISCARSQFRRDFKLHSSESHVVLDAVLDAGVYQILIAGPEYFIAGEPRTSVKYGQPLRISHAKFTTPNEISLSRPNFRFSLQLLDRSILRTHIHSGIIIKMHRMPEAGQSQCPRTDEDLPHLIVDFDDPRFEEGSKSLFEMPISRRFFGKMLGKSFILTVYGFERKSDSSPVTVETLKKNDSPIPIYDGILLASTNDSPITVTCVSPLKSVGIKSAYSTVKIEPAQQILYPHSEVVYTRGESASVSLLKPIPNRLRKSLFMEEALEEIKKEEEFESEVEVEEKGGKNHFIKSDDETSNSSDDSSSTSEQGEDSSDDSLGKKSESSSLEIDEILNMIESTYSSDKKGQLPAAKSQSKDKVPIKEKERGEKSQKRVRSRAAENNTMEIMLEHSLDPETQFLTVGDIFEDERDSVSVVVPKIAPSGQYRLHVGNGIKEDSVKSFVPVFTIAQGRFITPIQGESWVLGQPGLIVFSTNEKNNIKYSQFELTLFLDGAAVAGPIPGGASTGPLKVASTIAKVGTLDVRERPDKFIEVRLLTRNIPFELLRRVHFYIRVVGTRRVFCGETGLKCDEEVLIGLSERFAIVQRNEQVKHCSTDACIRHGLYIKGRTINQRTRMFRPLDIYTGPFIVPNEVRAELAFATLEISRPKVSPLKRKRSHRYKSVTPLDDDEPNEQSEQVSESDSSSSETISAEESAKDTRKEQTVALEPVYLEAAVKPVLPLRRLDVTNPLVRPTEIVNNSLSKLV